jgi:hypothetical protein
MMDVDLDAKELSRSLIDINGAKALEIIYEYDSGKNKIVWILTQANRPLRELPGCEQIHDDPYLIERVPIRLAHADYDPSRPGGEQEAREKVRKKFIEYWRIEDGVWT